MRKWIHFLPFILFTFFFEIFYLSYSIDEQTNILNNAIAGKVHPIVYWITPLIACHFLIYIIFSLRMLKFYEKSASEKYSDPKQVNLTWLSSTILFFLFFMAFLSLNSFIRTTVLSGYYNVLLNIIVLVIFAFVNKVLFRAFKTPEILSLIIDKEGKESNSFNQPVKYKASGLTEEEKQRILQVLLDHMESKKPFLEPELSLEQLATQLSLKSKSLSQAINELLKKNFFDFINQYRIDEAKKLLSNPKDKKITVSEILYEVGFNSKSSFNTLFKRYTGLTPSEFRKNPSS